jgi:hypothetical protein
MKQFRDTPYYVDEDGMIYKGVKKISQSKMSRGYLSVSIYHEGLFKTHYVHRIVAECYLENIQKKPLVNHLDGNKFNNSVKNLEWVTHKENSQHSVTILRKEMGERHSRAKVPDHIVLHIKDCKKQNLQLDFDKIASEYGVGVRHIKNIYNGKKRLFS